MEYKGISITAEMESYERWSIDEEGKPADKLDDLNSFDVTGYFFEGAGVSEFITMSETDGEMLREIADDLLKESAEAKEGK